MTKKVMLLVAVMAMGSLTLQANEEPASGFTVTKVALDAANSNADEDKNTEDKNASEKETQPEGGDKTEK